MNSVEMVVNGKTQVILVPKDSRDKTLNRLAFDGNMVTTMDLRDDGALVFTIQPKETT